LPPPTLNGRHDGCDIRLHLRLVSLRLQPLTSQQRVQTAHGRRDGGAGAWGRRAALLLLQLLQQRPQQCQVNLLGAAPAKRNA
jgi:hypothetical protein